MFVTYSDSSHEINPSVGTRNEDIRIYLLQLLRKILKISRRIEAAENHPAGGWFVPEIFDMSQIRIFYENTEYVHDCFESINVRSTLSFFCSNVLSEFAAGLKDTLETFIKVETIVTEAVWSSKPVRAILDLPFNTATGKYILCWNLRIETVAALKDQLLRLPELQVPSPIGVDSGDCYNINSSCQLEIVEAYCPRNEGFMIPISNLENSEQASENEVIGDNRSEIISISQVTSITPMDNSSHWGKETIDDNSSRGKVEEDVMIFGEFEGWSPRNPLTLREEGKLLSYSSPQSESPNMETRGDEFGFGEECSGTSTPPTPPCNDILAEKKVPIKGVLKEHWGVLTTTNSTLQVTEEEFEFIMASRIVRSHGATEVGKVLALLNRIGGWKGLEKLIGISHGGY